MTTFLHTADWQIGKPFGRIDDPDKRARVRQERIDAVDRIGKVAAEQEASFIVVAGDLFDTPTADKATVSAACSAIGRLGRPVYAIPGNHDHGGPGGIWEQEFFRREHRELAPNLHVLLETSPLELDDAILLPCPLLRRHEPADTTAWLRTIESDLASFPGKPRIVLAHGGVRSFERRDEDGGANQIDLDRLPDEAIDYVALGDWHGTTQAGPKAWYAGTPEPDRFPRGEDNQPGHVLVVTAARGAAPDVQAVPTARLGWHEFSFDFAGDSSLDHLESTVNDLLAKRAGADLLRLDLHGSLGLAASARLDRLLEAWQARLLRFDLTNRATVAPNETELEALTARGSDPLVSRVASRLVETAAADDHEAAVARAALRELHAVCANP